MLERGWTRRDQLEREPSLLHASIVSETRERRRKKRRKKEEGGGKMKERKRRRRGWKKWSRRNKTAGRQRRLEDADIKEMREPRLITE